MLHFQFIELIILISFSFGLNPKYVKDQLLIIPYPQSVEAKFGGKDAIQISENIDLKIINKAKTFFIHDLSPNEECNNECQEFLKDNFDFSIKKTLSSQNGLKDFRLSLHKKLDLEQIIPNIKATISSVSVKLTGENVFPKLKIGIPENYTLEIKTNEIMITAINAYGARHAFETLAQLIRISDKKFVIAQLPIKIIDYPRFKWRGMLIDPVRNVFDPSMFYRIIDALAMLKNNIIHLHLSDGQTFLFEVLKYKDLANKATYHSTKIFTHEIIKKLVDYGRKRGVIIYGEVDIPGHSASWNLGYPGVVADCWDHIVKDEINYGENRPALNPVNNNTVDIIKAIVKELGEAFDSDYVHIGGDEVNEKAWTLSKEYPQIKEFMNQHNFTKSIEIEGYFSYAAQNEIIANNKTAILFEELYDHGYSKKGSIIHIWSDERLFNKALSDGYEIIISTPYYVDQQMPRCKGYNKNSCEVTHNRFSWTYQDFYDFEPNKIIEQKYMNNVLGFEGCSWDESCDRQNFFNRAFQRYFTIAERMWSNEKMNENMSAEIRGSYFRCLALRRKIYDGSGPINPTLCDLPKKETI